MKTIHVLSQAAIDRIAAGEVVERPASIVKELVENAVDAGSNAITIEIKEGGLSMIRVTDNGEGIDPSQVQTAFLRHATSKIQDVSDLDTIGSLGFRGEALSSIGAVSQVELITRTPSSLTGVRYRFEGGAEKGLEEIGAPEGTTIIVRNVFYNTPARRKFLKSPTTEAGYISDLAEHLALSHPDVSFKFIHNGQTKLHTSGNNKIRDMIYSIYGRDTAMNLLPVDFTDGEVHIHGFIAKPVISRGNRLYENYFVNGRYIKSATISRAVESAYGNLMMQHRYPFTVLYIDMPGSDVDVNVHPAKMEVRFSETEKMYQRVYVAVKEAIEHKELIPKATLMTAREEQKLRQEEKRQRQEEARKSPEPFEKVRQDIFREGKSPYRPLYDYRKGSGTSDSGRDIPISPVVQPKNIQEPATETAGVTNIQTSDSSSPRIPVSEDQRSFVSAPDTSKPVAPEAELSSFNNTAPQASEPLTPSSENSPEPDSKEKDHAQAAGETSVTASVPRIVLPTLTKNAEPPSPKETQMPSKEEPVPSKPVQQTMEEAFPETMLSREARPRHKLIGQVFSTYWLVEFEDKLYIIDQHAAHEKIHYERLTAAMKTKEMTSQMISPPMIISLSLQEELVLKENLSLFEEVGFVIEPFGGRDYAIRGVPANMLGMDDQLLFTQMLSSLTEGREKITPEYLYEKLATMACKAAVKGGDTLSTAQANSLIEELLNLEDPYNCPHGRPTIISLSRYELERKFKRIL